MPGLVPVHFYHPTSKIHAGLDCPLPLRVFQDMVLKEQRTDVSFISAHRTLRVIMNWKLSHTEL